MTPTIRQIAENFSRHDFEKTFPFIADNIQWNFVGGELIIGKENVLNTCRQSANYLKTVKTTFTKFLVLESNHIIIIDTLSKYIDPAGGISHIASCDIYEFNQGQLSGITSYTIELKKESDK